MSKAAAGKHFLSKTNLSQALQPLLDEGLHADCIVVWVTPDVTVATLDTCGFSLPPVGKVRAAVLVYEGTPIDADALTGWRSHLLRHLECEVRCLFLTGKETTEEATTLFQQKATNLIGAIPPRETTAVRLRDWVKAPDRPQTNDLLLTMFFDSLGELLTQMDGIKRRFQGIATIESKARESYHESLDALLKENRSSQNTRTEELNSRFEGFRRQRDRIPRVLLLGETGVGKTLFANHLGDKKTPVTRVSVAEFINKEDMFEYALFGYCKGAYTEAKKDGDPGLLLSNIGGVLFLDEIGTATPAIQSKLLAYLDDFMVRPRGATNALFCPVLIVAATNEDVLLNSNYRQDLLQRFTDKLDIPPLRKLKHNFRYLVDAHLQNPAINTDEHRPVSEVGEKAFARLIGRDYKTGNFRELGNVLREACQRATSSGRDYLVEKDIDPETAPAGS